MFGLGATELIVIAVLILLIFGAKRLPGIGTGLGKTVKEISSIKKEMKGDTESSGKKEETEDQAAIEDKFVEGQEDKSPEGEEDVSLEGQVVGSIKKKMADKVLGQVPGIKQARQLKSTADKIKKIVS